MEQHDIDEYAIYNADGMNADILEYLAYVHMGEVDKAKSIAMNAIENGNTGNFVNEGKAFSFHQESRSLVPWFARLY